MRLCARCCEEVVCGKPFYCIHTEPPPDGHEVEIDPGSECWNPEPDPSDDHAAWETRVTNAETGGEKGSKLARFSLLPWDVLYELAEHFGKGARKYESRNWEKGYDWDLTIDALGRHLALWVSGQDTDPETGSSHLIAVAWHALALRWFQLHDKGKDFRANAG